MAEAFKNFPNPDEPEAKAPEAEVEKVVLVDDTVDEPEVEGKAEPAPEAAKDGGEKQDWIPPDKFHATNERLKEKSRELEEEKRYRHSIDEKLATFAERQKSKEEPEVEAEIVVPDPEADLPGFLIKTAELSQREQKKHSDFIEGFQRDQQQSREQQQQQQRVRGIAHHYVQDCHALMDEDKAFEPAYHRYHDAFVQQQAMLGLSPQQAEVEFCKREVGLATVALKQGKRPGEFMRDYVYQGGYNQGPPAAAPEVLAQPAIAPTEQPKAKPKAPGSLSSMSGTGAKSVTLSSISKMDQRSFNDLMDNNPEIYKQFKNVRVA